MKKTLLIFLLILSLFLSTGCDIEKPNKKVTVEPLPSIMLRFTLEKNIIGKGEDLPITLYYGTIDKYPDEFLYLYGELPEDYQTEFYINYSTAEKKLVSYGHPSPEYELDFISEGQFFHKNIEEFGSDKYLYSNPGCHYEMINLPSDLFKGEYGCISFIIKVYPIYQGEKDIQRALGGGVGLYYVIEDDNILLYDSLGSFRSAILK